MNRPELSIIYVYYNTPRDIVMSLKSIKQAAGKLKYEIIIVDNASFKKIPKQVKVSRRLMIVHNHKNVGYGSAINQVIQLSRGKFLLLLNADVVFKEDAIIKMFNKLKEDVELGIIGPQMLDEKRKVQLIGSGMPFLPGALFVFSFLGKIFPQNKYSKDYFLYDFDRSIETEIDVICGGCILIKKSLFNAVGSFDKRFFMYFEEADLCYRVKKAGFKILYYPEAKVVHPFAKSSSDKKWIRRTFERSRFMFFRKYHGLILAIAAEGFLRLTNFSSSILKHKYKDLFSKSI